jgi:hypothetical protein
LALASWRLDVLAYSRGNDFIHILKIGRSPTQRWTIPPPDRVSNVATCVSGILGRLIAYYNFEMQKWEYRILGKLTEVELNTMGIEGWELISIAFIERGNVYTHYFKRPNLALAGVSQS